LSFSLYVAAHFVNWPPQPAKSHAVIGEGDSNGYTITSGDNVNGSSGGGSNTIGGNNDLASILVRLSEQEQSQLVRLARLVSFSQRRRHYSSANSSPSILSSDHVRIVPPFSSSDSLLRILHSQRMKRNVPPTQQQKKEPDDKNNDDDAIWEMLRDWIAQEQRMMAADQPPSERPRQEMPSAEDAESFESSGDHKESLLAIVTTKDESKNKKTDKVVMAELGETKEANPAMVEERFVDDFVPAEEMALAESLILLPVIPQHPAVVNSSTQQQQQKGSPTTQQRLSQPTSIITPARSDHSSLNRSEINETSAGHLLLLTGDEDGDGSTSTEFAYDDHVVEIVQLDPFATVIPVPAPHLRQEEEPSSSLAKPEPPMNKTTSNSAVDVIADSSSHPSSGGDDDDDFKLLFEPTPLLLLVTPPMSTKEEQVSTILQSQENDDVPRLSSATESEAAASAGSTFLEIPHHHQRLNANVSQLMPLNVTNDTLPPDADEIEPDPAVNGTWPLVIVPTDRPLPVKDHANGVMIDSSPSLLSISLAGNISEELLSPWLPPDVISYRGPVVQSAFLTPESTTTIAVADEYAGCDCQCPSDALLVTPPAVDSMPTSFFPTTQSIPDLVPLSCPPLPPACVMTEVLTSTTTTTTTAMPTTTTEATTTPTTTTATTPTTTTKMIPPILILEGEGRRGFERAFRLTGLFVLCLGELFESEREKN
jgi:hypothetical protein